MSKPSGFNSRYLQIDVAGVVVCALVTAACYFTLLRPVSINSQSYAQLQPQVSRQAQAVKDARAALASLQAELDSTRRQLADLPLHLEPSSQVNSRLANLTELASKIGIEVHQIQPEPARAGKRYDIVSIDLAGSGDYGQVTHFMRLLHDRFADIAVVNFELKSGGPVATDAQFDIGLAWYTLPALGLVENN
jgi:Tfp pilus assembly protein PilO